MTTLLVVLKERHCVMEERARDWDDEDRREKEIRRLFRLGLKRCCATAIWAKLAEHAGEVYGVKTPTKLADVFKVKRNNTNAFTDGQMDLDSLCLMLAAVDQSYELLDKPPAMEERILSGYLEVCHWLDKGSAVPSKRLSGLRSDFLAVCMVLRDYEYGETLELTKKQWSSLAKHIGSELNRGIEPDFLRELVDKWGERLPEAVDHIVSAFGWGMPETQP